jgi:crotonobetainyl-CoA:carnitine CoA-transferase CaiB-like acyl-CoA transferase
VADPAARLLDGLRILDLTRLLPGAYATLLLADLGADVIKIEDPNGGDGMRRIGGDASPYFELLNRNKRSVTLDLRSPRAATVLDALISKSDGLVESFRPSTARRLAVDAARLRARHPRLVCASIAGFGADGPYAERAAHDINYQALAGLLDGSGVRLRDDARPRESGRHPPQTPGPLVADITAAMHTALGIVAALFRRERTGEGSFVDVSIHEAALHWSMFPSTDDLEAACYTLYETADGHWLALGALESKFWNGFCERIGRGDLTARRQARGDERRRILDEVRAVMKTRTRAEWLARFEDADVCLTPIYNRAETEADPHLAARGVLAASGTVTYVTMPGVRVRPAPALGADTEGVLEEAGIDAETRASLRRESVI